MPTKITFILMAGFLSSGIFGQNVPPSQNSFGEILYPHANSILSSGSVTKNNPGFLMAGYKPSATQGSNFFIDRTAEGGSTQNNPVIFQREYSLFLNPACSAPLSLATNCSGISAIETFVPGSIVNGTTIPAKHYAIAGAINEGCFFSFLSSTGVPINTYFINFALIQGVNSLASVSKPIILEASVATSGMKEYYICGTYDFVIPIINYPISVLYAHRVNAAGSILWSRQYLCASGGYININAMVESPYNQNLVMVGKTIFSGVIINLDRSTGGTIFSDARLYNVKNNPSAFSSIAVSSQQSGTGAGYIIGGDNNCLGNSGQAWISKINPIGNVVWSTVVTPASDPKAGRINGVLERQNQSGQYEYYGVMSSTAGILALKFNQLGKPFLGANEFVYNSGTLNNPSNATSISFSDGNGFDDGLHIFGNNTATSPTAHYLCQAYFSGHDGCNAVNKIPSHEEAQVLKSEAALFDLNLPLTHCNTVLLTSTVVSAYNAICGPVNTIPLPASNARPVATGISDPQVTTMERFNIYPNPVTDKTTITYESMPESGIIKVDLYNSMGQLIKTISGEKNTSLELDFKALDLESGVYFVCSGSEGLLNKQKIIYTKL